MKLIDALKKIRDEGPQDHDKGICFNASQLCDDSASDVYACIKNLALNWPDRDTTSSDDDPVGDYRFHGYKSRRNGERWKNPRRHALLKWLIEELSK